ncbi:MAG: amidohydrolase family protein, partial [Acidimicrobiales bacterium]|nr:amidohydrolase family protein [Acidimicrobiales bacterium]
MTESILEPDLPIIDPHHHLWDFEPLLGSFPESAHPFAAIPRLVPRYLFEELRADMSAGHNVVGTVYVECGMFYRADASPEMSPVGEVEFVNGTAARFASGIYGNARGCAGIVGHVDLTIGDRAAAVLEAEIAAGNGRFRGIRHIGAHDPDDNVLGALVHAPATLYTDDAFRAGFEHLGRLGLTFDAWVLEPQISEVADLARTFTDTPIVLDHVGTPLGIGAYSGRLDERFDVWRDAIRELASCPNVMVKLGGLAMPFPGFPGLAPDARPTSETLAQLWRPYVETCIEAFTPARAMFESNFPVDRWGADYVTVWNAFKRIAAGASPDDKRDLFSASAARFYNVQGL